MPAKSDYAKNPEKYRAQARAWYAENGERARERQRRYESGHRQEAVTRAAAWAKANPKRKSEQTTASRRKRNGFPRVLFDERLGRQAGLCAICEIALGGGPRMKAACADHCHQNGGPRGVLCKRCNLMLGHARDDASILQAAIAYLDFWKRTA